MVLNFPITCFGCPVCVLASQALKVFEPVEGFWCNSNNYNPIAVDIHLQWNRAGFTVSGILSSRIIVEQDGVYSEIFSRCIGQFWLKGRRFHQV